MMTEKLTESNNPSTKNIDSFDTMRILEVMNREDSLVPEAVRTQLPSIAQAVDVIVDAFRRGGRLFYVGAGTSGRIGILDASECPPTFHTPPEMVQAIIAGGDVAIRQPVEDAEDDVKAGACVVSQYGMGSKDVMVGITASGNTPYVLGAVEEARRNGITTIGISCNKGQRLEEMAEISILLLVGPEVIQGSTRLKAGTAQKLVLNMLTTCSMIRIGKVYGNLMVDLTPCNEKLRERSRQIIMDVAGVDYETARMTFIQAEEDVKLAIIMLKAGCTADQGREHLKRSNGVLSLVLAEWDENPE